MIGFWPDPSPPPGLETKPTLGARARTPGYPGLLAEFRPRSREIHRRAFVRASVIMRRLCAWRAGVPEGDTPNPGQILLKYSRQTWAMFLLSLFLRNAEIPTLACALIGGGFRVQIVYSLFLFSQFNVPSFYRDLLSQFSS